MRGRACLIVNPAAGRGGAHDKIPHIREAFGARGITELVETTVAGEEESLAREAINRGATTIVAVGGDGTCSGVANAILRADALCRLAVLPAGTGNDFAKTLGVTRHTPEMIAELVVNGREVPIDVGLADGRHFLNSCGFGFDAAVLDSSLNVRGLQGDAVYIYAAFTKLFTYRGVRVSPLGVAGVEAGEMLMVTVSIGRSLGGAFTIAPTASVLDGKLDVCFFRAAGVIGRARLFAAVMRGTHLAARAVSSAKVERLSLGFGSSPAMEMDGELRVAKSKSVELRCLPAALRVLAAPGALR